jgi:hypothetical protein
MTVRYPWFRWLVVVCLAGLFAACNPLPAAASMVEVRISDHREAIGDFERLDITINSVGLHPATAPRTEGWLDFEPDTARVDLTQVVGGPTVTILQTNAPPGQYDAVRLVVASGQGVLKEGDTVWVPGFEAIARHPFVLPGGDTITLVLDVIVESKADHPGGGYEMNLLKVMSK